MERNNGGVRRVPLSDAAVMDLVPGEVFLVSKINEPPERFIRVLKPGATEYEELWEYGGASSRIRITIPLSQAFPGATLKYQTIMTDGEWRAFKHFLRLILRWQLDRGQIWKLLMCFQSMDIEREMAELAQKKEAGQ